MSLAWKVSLDSPTPTLHPLRHCYDFLNFRCGTKKDIDNASDDELKVSHGLPRFLKILFVFLKFIYDIKT